MEATKYYAMIDGERRGPFRPEELPAAGVRPSTFVWTKGMADWEPAGDVADICRLFRNRLHDLMHPAASASDPHATTSQADDFSKTTDFDNATPRKDRLPVEQPSLASIEEISESEQNNITPPPAGLIPLAWIVTFLCFPPTGIAALVYAYRGKNAWKTGDTHATNDFCRLAKMLTAISFFLGLFVYAFIFRFN